MHDSPDIWQVHVDIVDIIQNFSSRSCHSHAVGFDNEKSAAISVSVERAELYDNQIAGDFSLDAKLKEIFAIGGASEEVDLIDHFCWSKIAKYTH